MYLDIYMRIYAIHQGFELQKRLFCKKMLLTSKGSKRHVRVLKVLRVLRVLRGTQEAPKSSCSRRPTETGGSKRELRGSKRELRGE